MGKTQKKLSTHKRRSLKKRNKGGNLFGDAAVFGDAAELALGASHLRNVYYVDWLEERLILHFKDMNWLKSTREKFAYDKTSMLSFPQSILTKYCGREPEDKQAISPAFAQAQCPLDINRVLNKGVRVGVGAAAAAAAQKVVNNKGVVANNMQQQPFQNRNRKPFQQPQPQPKQPQPKQPQPKQPQPSF